MNLKPVPALSLLGVKGHRLKFPGSWSQDKELHQEHMVIKMVGSWRMLRVKACNALTEDLSVIPRSHFRQLTTVWRRFHGI